MRRTEVVIIGAGILGLSLAYHLTKRGIPCILLEREIAPALHASGRGAGMIRHLYSHPQLTEWTRRSIEAWPTTLRDRCFRKTGSIIIDRATPGHSQDLFFDTEISLTRPGGVCLLPAIYTENDGVIDPHSFMKGLFEVIDKRQFEAHFEEAVLRIAPGNGEVIVRTAKNIYSSTWVVNAAGAWVNNVLGKSAEISEMKVQPFARHLFVVSGWPSGFMPGSPCDYYGDGFYWDETNGWYMREWGESTRLVSICDRVPADPNFFTGRPEVRLDVHRALSDNLPTDVYKRLQFEDFWYCFRTYTTDQLPIWGPDNDIPGLFWLAAFGGYGMSTGFAAAEDAARKIVGESVPVSPAFYPERSKKKNSPLRAANELVS